MTRFGPRILFQNNTQSVTSSVVVPRRVYFPTLCNDDSNKNNNPVKATKANGELILNLGIARAEPDGTRAETRFRLSPKRTSPFKSVGASVQSTAGSRGVRISLSNAA